MEIRLLGSLEVIDDRGATVGVSGRRLQTLLAVLALRCGEVVPVDRVVEDLWGDERTRSVNALQRQVSTLRRALGSPGVVEWRGSGYMLHLEREAIDVFRFEALTASGRAAMGDRDAANASALLSEALALWRGDALADFAYEEFAQAAIGRLAEARLAAIEARIDADLALGRHAALVAELELLVAEHPFREHLRAQHMIALSRSGRQAEALRSYQSVRALLGDELGLEPSHELRTLETSILRQDVSIVSAEIEQSSRRERTNLRTPLTPLIGRSEELAALIDRVHTQRLVTLVGPGGSGKTRLAIETGRACLRSDDGEAWLVELADVPDPGGVLPALLRALDLPDVGGSDTDLRRVAEYLRGRRVHVLLDNCEHVVARAAEVALKLLELCPTLTILSTSREALGVTGEVLWPVPPLPLEDAVTLFVERGRAAAPLSDLDVNVCDTRLALQDICARLDGLPLAIELAAARLHSMPLHELAAGLDDRFRLLSRGARTARPRQQTLRAVVDWSYGLLFDDERRVLDRLSVFAGGCTFPAARVVCADDEITADDVSELLTRLADKSLISIVDEKGGAARCRMLQTLVDYGRERLAASGEATRVYTAHARYFKESS